ncbi:hypothetical protein LINPERHAP2_LOCUS33004 [Linum perenne]
MWNKVQNRLISSLLPLVTREKPIPLVEDRHQQNPQQHHHQQNLQGGSFK